MKQRAIATLREDRRKGSRWKVGPASDGTATARQAGGRAGAPPLAALPWDVTDSARLERELAAVARARRRRRPRGGPRGAAPGGSGGGGPRGDAPPRAAPAPAAARAPGGRRARWAAGRRPHARA